MHIFKITLIWDNKLLFYSQNCHDGAKLVLFVFLNCAFVYLNTRIFLLNLTIKLYGL